MVSSFFVSEQYKEELMGYNGTCVYTLYPCARKKYPHVACGCIRFTRRHQKWLTSSHMDTGYMKLSQAGETVAIVYIANRVLLKINWL